MTNRFTGLDLIDRVPEEPLTEVCDIVQEAVIKNILKKKTCKRAKRLSEEALQIAEKRRETKGKGKKERYIHLNGIRHSPIPLQYSLQWQPTPILGVPWKLENSMDGGAW